MPEEAMTSPEYFRQRSRTYTPPDDWQLAAGGLSDAAYLRLRNTGDTADEEGVLTYDGTDLTFYDGTTTHVLENNAVIVEKAGTVVGTRPRINFIEGANITLTVTDDGTDNEVDVTIGASVSGTGATIVTGSYTGDGATSMAISGLGVAPKLVWIVERATAAVNPAELYVGYTTDTIVDDNANGATINDTGGGSDIDVDAIISLDADGFTVDDNGSDAHPNKSAQVYNYYVIG